MNGVGQPEFSFNADSALKECPSDQHRNELSAIQEVYLSPESLFNAYLEHYL
jgi:hypothetical protein